MDIWISWSGLFTSLPFGDPYIAFAVVCVFCAVSARILVDREYA